MTMLPFFSMPFLLYADVWFLFASPYPRGPTGKNQVGLSPKSGTPLANFPQAEMCRGYLKEPSHDGVAGQLFRVLIPFVSFPYIK
jgi:hypothetical protein